MTIQTGCGPLDRDALHVIRGPPERGESRGLGDVDGVGAHRLGGTKKSPRLAPGGAEATWKDGKPWDATRNLLGRPTREQKPRQSGEMQRPRGEHSTYGAISHHRSRGRRGRHHSNSSSRSQSSSSTTRRKSKWSLRKFTAASKDVKRLNPLKLIAASTLWCLDKDTLSVRTTMPS